MYIQTSIQFTLLKVGRDGMKPFVTDDKLTKKQTLKLGPF